MSPRATGSWDTNKSVALLSYQPGRVTGAGSSQKYAVILARPVHRVWGLGILVWIFFVVLFFVGFFRGF